MSSSQTAPARSFSRRARRVGPQCEAAAITSSRNSGDLPADFTFGSPSKACLDLLSHFKEVFS